MGGVKSNIRIVLNGKYAPKLDYVIAIDDVIWFMLTIHQGPENF